MIAGTPAGPVAVPGPVADLAGPARLTPVWRNQLGGLTWQLGDGPQRRFVKWAPAGSGLDLASEVQRLRWAARFTPVPVVLEHGADDDGEWLLTVGLPGRSAVDPRWLADPGPAVDAIGAGLRALHDALPVEACPFDWSAGERLVHAFGRQPDGVSFGHAHHDPLRSAPAPVSGPRPPSPVAASRG